MEFLNKDITFCIENNMVESEAIWHLRSKYPHLSYDDVWRILKKGGIVFPRNYIEYYRHTEKPKLTPDRIKELHAISVDSFVPIQRTQKGLIQKGQHKKYLKPRNGKRR